MKVYKSFEEISCHKNTFLTIGTFDGIHLGHKKIINSLIQRASVVKGRSILVTFYPHPKTVVKTEKHQIELITPLEEKIEILETSKLDGMLVVPFSQVIASIEPEIFIKHYLVDKIGVRSFIIGYNHAFGKKRKGGPELLQELGAEDGFSVEIIPPVRSNDDVVSSTRIRKLIKEGKIQLANQLLGREYSLSGVVRKGKRLGQEIGFPTANIDVLGERKLVPGDGVYAVFVHIENKIFSGMANLGINPTINGTIRGIEVHIHNFSSTIYNQQLKIDFVKRIRDEMLFDSIDELIVQIQSDRIKSLELLSKNTRR
jgi:riboflavin kinase/FMN adenylyltransferase